MAENVDTSEWSKPRRRVAVACAVSAALTLILGATYFWSVHRNVTQARRRARGEAARAAKVIDGELRSFEAVVRGVASDLDAGRVGRPQLSARLREAVDATPQMAGIGAAFTPLSYDPNLRLYAPYYQREGDGVKLVSLDARYDYTQGHEWYSKPLKDGPSWSEPSAPTSESAGAVEFSAPFRLGASGGKAGVVHGTMSLREIEELVSTLNLGEFGYGFLVSKGGVLISHPLAEGSSRAAPASLLEDGADPVTGEPCWVFSESVPSTGWTVGVVFFKELSSRDQALRRQEIRFAVGLVATACLFLAFLLEPHRRSQEIRTLWAGSVIGSAILGLSIAWLWRVGYRPAVPPPGETSLVDKAGVRQFILDTTRRTLKRSGDLPLFVPTGVFLQTLEINGPNNVSVTGYVWQKYASNVSKSVTRGFVLPDAVERTITEAYRRVDGETETVGWYVKAVIRQNFDYSGYPLDQQDFKLRLWHADLDGRVVLVPDQDSYRIIHPLARAGFESGFDLPGWTVERTQFSSRPRDRTTTFGLDGSRAGTELSFDALIDRRVLEPVFSCLLPLGVSTFMVFSLLLMIKEATRANIIQTLAAYSALFFVIILSQLDMRRRVSGTNILYIEYFYFATYGAMLVAALVTLTNGWPGHFPKVEQREHLFPKLLFWPVTLGVLAVITICALY
jgi:hypothetical protein